jgi:hypothetical protein
MEQFWKPEPKEPWHDWRTYSMLIPILSGTVGACIFMALGFSFTEMASIPARIRTPMVILASFTVAIGSTFGSVGSGIEVFRKRYTGDAQGWDWISLAVSTATTVAGFGMGFAALLGATTGWSATARVYGSLVVGTLAALDSLGDMIECGGLFGSYETRVEQWRVERERWRVQTGQAVNSAESNVAQTLDALVQAVGELKQRWTWPEAHKSDFDRICSRLNGGAPDLTRERLAVLLAEEQLNLPSSSTVDRWLKMVKE